nr:uncharacterized protein LOC129263379 [Lytechinus pictus]
MACMALGAAALFLMLVAGLDAGLAENTTAWTSSHNSSEQEWTFELTTSLLQDVPNLTTTSTLTEMVNVTIVSDENLDAGFFTRGDKVQTVTLESSASAYDESSDSVPWRWHYPTWSWWQLVQLTSSVLGVVGQMLVMLVIWQRRAMNRSADTLIGALAVADFLTSILILPLPVAVSVPSTLLGEIYCRFIFNGFFMWLAVGASIHTLALISVERLIAVMYPILFNRSVTMCFML